MRSVSLLRMFFATHVAYDPGVVITTKRSCSSKPRCLWSNNSDVSSVEVILVSTLPSPCVKWYLKVTFLLSTSIQVFHSFIQLRTSDLETKTRTGSRSRVFVQAAAVETSSHEHSNGHELLNEHRVPCSWGASMVSFARCVWFPRVLRVNMMISLTMWSQRFSTMWVKVMNV